ncbi:MAG: histidine phosphatase family protein [Alphaproteobacteria bacterium]|nr:histidine phosphatase family protein [Alphaproteobacteria bacterium]
MTRTTRWWWVRHAKALNHDNRVYGNTLDVSVDTSDPVSFRALAGTLPGNAVLIRNQLNRSVQTAEAIQAQGFAPSRVQVEEELQELCFGDWQGLSYDKIREVSGGHPVWFTPLDLVPPKGESFVQMRTRVISGIERLTKELAGHDIVSISHGGPIRVAIGHALDFDANRSVYFRVDNLSLTRLDYHHAPDAAGGTWQVHCVNVLPDALEAA